MRNPLRWAVVLVFGFGMAVAVTGARAEEEKIPLSKVPKAVVAAVEARFPGAAIKEAEKEEEDGKTVYELEITSGGQELEVSVKPDGTIVSVEKEIKVADLPAAVTEAVKAKYPKATIKKAEEVDEDGKITYEVVIEKTAGKKTELVVDKTGKILDEEDADKD